MVVGVMVVIMMMMTTRIIEEEDGSGGGEAIKLKMNAHHEIGVGLEGDEADDVDGKGDRDAELVDQAARLAPMGL